jgi:hypothetical protein
MILSSVSVEVIGQPKGNLKVPEISSTLPVTILSGEARSFDFMEASGGISCENPGLNSVAPGGRTESCLIDEKNRDSFDDRLNLIQREVGQSC